MSGSGYGLLSITRGSVQSLNNTITAVVSLAVAFCPLATSREKDEQTIGEIDAASSQALRAKPPTR